MALEAPCHPTTLYTGPMLSLRKRIHAASKLLAPYAVPIQGQLGRVHPEKEDETRFPFQRDRDRIIHTQAFRRLKGKTQVFVASLRQGAVRQAGHGDHYRTRITHTLEVMQISRDIARTLSLNEDLAECIALAHDLGHTPFGHAGEEAMAECMEPFGKSFEHNEQSLRIVTLLEDRSKKYSGLNLEREILEGLLKHRTPHDTPYRAVSMRAPTLEAQIVNLADEIAYTAHDTDDGLRAGLFERKNIEETKLGTMASSSAKAKGTELRGALVDLLVTDLYRETERRLKRYHIRTIGDVYAETAPLVQLSPSMQKEMRELRTFLWDHLYKSPAVLRQARRGKQMIKTLFRKYMSRPPRKVILLQRKTHGALEDAAKDYIAGMTDTYADAAFRSSS